MSKIGNRLSFKNSNYFTDSDGLEYKLSENNKVKIYVQVMDLAASGGYYLALAGDKIVAHPTSLVGSIGVIALKVNLKDLMTKIGVEWEIVKLKESLDEKIASNCCFVKD